MKNQLENDMEHKMGIICKTGIIEHMNVAA